MKAEDLPPRPAPRPVPLLEGVGSVLVLSGLLAAAGIIVTPEVWPTLVPVTAGCLGSGIGVVWWSRVRVRARERARRARKDP